MQWNLVINTRKQVYDIHEEMQSQTHWLKEKGRDRTKATGNPVYKADGTKTWIYDEACEEFRPGTQHCSVLSRNE